MPADGTTAAHQQRPLALPVKLFRHFQPFTVLAPDAEHRLIDKPRPARRSPRCEFQRRKLFGSKAGNPHDIDTGFIGRDVALSPQQIEPRDVAQIRQGLRMLETFQKCRELAAVMDQSGIGRGRLLRMDCGCRDQPIAADKAFDSGKIGLKRIHPALDYSVAINREAGLFGQHAKTARPGVVQRLDEGVLKRAQLHGNASSSDCARSRSSNSSLNGGIWSSRSISVGRGPTR